jgi:hypothetical protein
MTNLEVGGEYYVNIGSDYYNIVVQSITKSIEGYDTVYFNADKIDHERRGIIPMEPLMHETISNINVISVGHNYEGGGSRYRIKYSKKRSKRRSTKRRSTKRRSTKRKSKQRKYKKRSKRR